MTVKSITHHKITVLGVGNILLKDEGFGVSVVNYIKEKNLLPEGVNIIDGGTGGMRLIPIIMNTDCLIVIDAVKGNGTPGDIYRFTIKDIPLKIRQKTSLHEISLQEVFSLLNLLEGKNPETIIIGVEPKETSFGMGFSQEVESVIPAVASKVIEEVEGFLKRQNITIYPTGAKSKV